MGYAEIVRSKDRPEECRGVIVFDEEADLGALEPALRGRKSVYSGVVYAHAEARVATFPVEIRHFDRDAEEAGATFVAHDIAL
jgi:hypothetical protein